MTRESATGRAASIQRSAVGRRFEAAVFDWDGTAVPDRRADARTARRVFAALLEAGFDLAVVTGTNVANVERQLRLLPQGPGRMVIACNRGSELYELGPDGLLELERRVATAEEEAQLDEAAELAVERFATRGLETAVVSARLNRRKIDLIPLEEWADPPKAELPELLSAVERRLAAADIDGLPEAVALVRDCGLDAGLADPRVTSDAKHVEVGLTDKSDAARTVFAWLEGRGIRPEEVIVAGDEVGPMGGCPGSDSLLLVPESAGAVCISVGPEPNGVPPGVVHLAGGPAVFLRVLADQVRRRRIGELPQAAAEPGWQITLEGHAAETEAYREAVLSLGDGRFGTRGALLSGSDRSTVLASGHYAARGSEEELLECPPWNRLDGARGDRVRRTLDLRTGTLRHQIERGAASRLEALLFPALARPGTASLRARGTEDLLVSSGPLAQCVQRGTETRSRRVGTITIAESSNVERLVAAAVEQRSSSLLDRAVVYADREEEALAALRTAEQSGFDRLYAEQRERWGERWRDADVTIEGDAALQLGVRFSLFQLMASVPDAGEAAVGARGLSGFLYSGHVFWDADVYTLPFFAATHPESARAMLRYRLNRLASARASASARGRAGARFPWESTRSGFDVTPATARARDGTLIPIRTGTHEEHITAAVAWAADCYLGWSGDEGLAADARLLFVETARYWASRIRVDRSGAAHIYGVIGPDEYHEPVDDSAFTNVMARWNLRRAAREVENHPELNVSIAERGRWLELADALVDGYDPETGVYEEFAGFNRLDPLLAAEIGEPPYAADALLPLERVRAAQIIKQADVVLLHHLVPEEMAPGSLEPNLAFYEPRTSHGSSLSPALHALLHARVGSLERAEQYLRMAARFDLDDLNRTAAGGLHIATMGGVWQALAYGFAGIRPTPSGLVVDPRLPASWRALDLSVRFHGSRVHVRAEHDGTFVSASPAAWVVGPSGPVEVGPQGLEL